MTTRAQVTFQSTSGLPEDAFVNTFHFGAIGAAPFAPGTIEDLLEEFYNDPHGIATFPLAAHLGESVSRTQLATIKLYDLEDAMPRVPYLEHTFDPVDPHGSSNFPQETAMVISWTAPPVSGVPRGRTRGRTYIGPLLTDAGQITDGVMRPVAEIIIDLTIHAAFLVGDNRGDLVVFSEAAGSPNAWPIIGGYVDNAFDTMRSRGPEATARTLF